MLEGVLLFNYSLIIYYYKIVRKELRNAGILLESQMHNEYNLMGKI